MMDNREKLTKFGLYDPRFERDACGVGFVCDIKGKKSNQIIRDGLEVLKRLSHRGATGADPKTGDGAGILMQIPHEFFAKACAKERITLPEQGSYAAGLVFLPRDMRQRTFCKDAFRFAVTSQGQRLLGWRRVPLDNSGIGRAARKSQPVIEQVFIGRGELNKDILAFERRLYLIRKQIESNVAKADLSQKAFFYITNLSCRSVSYKGLLMPSQLEGFFTDLKDKDIKSSLCLVHSRYSTNTFPTWNLAQPFRYLAHNGEINTLRGNINWMQARQGLLESNLFGRAIKEMFPVIVPGGSDSAAIDNVLELLVLGGRPLAHAMMMLIPEAWQRDPRLSRKLKDFYAFHSCFMESWDGPAAMAFTDGISIGAMLDRNGLRPARYIITKNGLVVMASEAGVLDIAPADILSSGRLEPGKIFFIDTQAGRIIDDKELKEELASRQPYGQWLKENMIQLDGLPSHSVERIADRKNPSPLALDPSPEGILTQLKAFGYTREDLKMIIKPMIETAQEPVGAMGNDTPHAVLSQKPQLLYSYFKQLFAQVTNPAIDPIREELVMSLDSYLGPEKNILEETPRHCHKLKIGHLLLTDEELLKIRDIHVNSFKTKELSMLFSVEEEGGFLSAMERICHEAEAAIEQGYTFIILTDRGIDHGHAALPALLAVSGLHHFLVDKSLRTQIGIILESAEPREVHHFALLFGYGADAVNPYLAYEAVRYLVAEKEVAFEQAQALRHYLKAVEKGILKILSKMGISTLQSYRGAQIFEALGLHQDFIERFFSGTVSRIGGAGLEAIIQETVLRHQEAFAKQNDANLLLFTGGVYQWNRDGEFHLWNPESIAALQDSVRNADYRKFKEFSRLINDQGKNPCTLRSLLKFKSAKAIAIDEVEPVEQIVRRFATGAMSFGSISKEAHQAIAIALNRLGGRSNTGEGGEDPLRFIPLANGDSTRSAVKQVASGRFGVTTNYLMHADEIQIKIAQGAKPGEGGQLPGHKVSVEIARTRYTTPGVSLISPPPHHDIYSIEDLAQLIFELKNVNPQADISVKLVSEIGVGTVAAGVAKGRADKILISGGDGGTGASPLSSIRHAGLPWELGLTETHQTLLLNGLRSRVRLQADGQMRTGRDVAIAALLGAEEFGFCTAILIVLGCVMLRHCNLNNCSVGIATQDELLRKRFSGKPEYIVNYLRFVAEELREIMAGLGIRRLIDMVGRSDLVEVNNHLMHDKAKDLDFSRILYRPEFSKNVVRHCASKQGHRLENLLDLELICRAKVSLTKRQKTKMEFGINNTNRAAGAMLSGKVCKAFGEEGLPEDTIYCKFKGIAGQSFGAWLARGVTFELEGMANDYVGKGISGGKIIIYPDKKSSYLSQENIIIGNTTFYGAITGEAYIRGVAGERFCIRNSGLLAVVEGVGDHGCEYMTGGRVVVLGKTGRNFAAGMSGGIAYVYDASDNFRNKCNTEMVVLEKLSEEDAAVVKNLLANHYRYTQSTQAKKIADNFLSEAKKFVKVIPIEYKRILEASASGKQIELTEVLEG